jgi:hypothetical protein
MKCGFLLLAILAPLLAPVRVFPQPRSPAPQHQKSTPTVKLEINARLPRALIPAKLTQRLQVNSSQTWPYVETVVNGIKYTIAFNERTRRITYLYTSDDKFRTVNGLRIGAELTFTSAQLIIIPYGEVRGPRTPDGWFPVVAHDSPLGGGPFINSLKDGEKTTMTISGFAKGGD